jgi:hypothetical protein
MKPQRRNAGDVDNSVGKDITAGNRKRYPTQYPAQCQCRAPSQAGHNSKGAVATAASATVAATYLFAVGSREGGSRPSEGFTTRLSTNKNGNTATRLNIHRMKNSGSTTRTLGAALGLSSRRSSLMQACAAANTHANTPGRPCPQRVAAARQACKDPPNYDISGSSDAKTPERQQQQR